MKKIDSEPEKIISHNDDMKNDFKAAMSRHAELSSTPEGLEILRLEGLEIRRQELEAEQAEARQYRKERLMKASNTAWESAAVPKRIRRVLSGEMQSTQAFSAVKSWIDKADHESWCLLLCGSPGVGKSVSAAWWLREYLAFSKKWCHIADIIRTGLYGEELTDYWKCDAMVIDDIGVEFRDSKGAFDSLFDGIVEKRCAQECRTIITTNVSPSELSRRYGERVVDRFRLGTIFVANDESLRKSS